LFKKSYSRKHLMKKAQACLDITYRSFPGLISEMRGYAEAAGVSFRDAWLLSLEDELFLRQAGRCSTLVANQGKLMAHNEDWDEKAQDAICVLKKSLNGLSIFELFYMNTLGGNAVSVNSHGIAQAVNTLTHADMQTGVPRNVIARWLSETGSPEADYINLKNVPRASGYSHTLISRDGAIWNIECSAREQRLCRPAAPYVHTNHYISELSRLEQEDNSTGSLDRYRFLSSHAEDTMPADRVRELMGNQSEGGTAGVFNDRTIARMLVDFNNMDIFVWLRREDARGWVRYPLLTAL
jgi:hypothetical protein